MAVLACLYGLLKTGSICIPINLLAAVVYAPSDGAADFAINNSFHPGLFFIAVILHLATSILVGLLYGGDASHVRAPAHRVRRADRASVVVGSALTRFLGLRILYWKATSIGFGFIASQIGFGVVRGDRRLMRQSRVNPLAKTCPSPCA